MAEARAGDNHNEGGGGSESGAGSKRQRSEDGSGDSGRAHHHVVHHHSHHTHHRHHHAAAPADTTTADDNDDDEDYGPRAPAAPPTDSTAAAATTTATAAATTEDGSDDDGYGPRAPAPSSAAAPAAAPPRRQAPPKQLANESAYLAALPCAAAYEKSHMHRDAVTHTVVTPRGDYFITGSADGVLKFWKKTRGGIVPVKMYRAHAGPLVAVVVSPDGLRLASCGDDATLKVYDVMNFDMADMVQLPFQPGAAAWVYGAGSGVPYLAVSDRHTPAVHLYDGDNLAGVAAPVVAALDARDDDADVVVTSTREPSLAAAAAAAVLATPAAAAVAKALAVGGRSRGGVPVATVSSHTAPVVLLAYNSPHAAVISVDAKGVIDYWSASRERGFGSLPPGATTFAYKMETALFDLAKARAAPQSLAVSPNGALFATTSSDRLLRVFRFRSGTLARVVSDTLETHEAVVAATAAAAAALAAGSDAVPLAAAGGMDALDFGRRAATERELAAAAATAAAAFVAPPLHPPRAGVRPDAVYRPPPANAVFDDSGNFLLYPTLAGIKVLNLVTNKVVASIGSLESSERFLGIALYQGAPKAEPTPAGGTASAPVPTMMAAAATAAAGGGSASSVDPTILCTAFRRNRFYLFSRREPADLTSMTTDGRDVFNEPPTKEDLVVAAEASAAVVRAKLGSEAVVHTSVGDLFLTLLPSVAPRAVENFCGHARAGYYNNLLFHRVIKDFMVQTGDPNGDGTGGTSIWGTEFEDEIDRSYRFDRPGVLAMANAGPGTNGSQFFITTVPTPWLDGKHTIFGRLRAGTEVLKAIEDAPVRAATDRPLADIKIVSIDIL